MTKYYWIHNICISHSRMKLSSSKPGPGRSWPAACSQFHCRQGLSSEWYSVWGGRQSSPSLAVLQHSPAWPCPAVNFKKKENFLHLFSPLQWLLESLGREPTNNDEIIMNFLLGCPSSRCRRWSRRRWWRRRMLGWEEGGQHCNKSFSTQHSPCQAATNLFSDK